jgi:hypothetical protein
MFGDEGDLAVLGQALCRCDFLEAHRGELAATTLFSSVSDGNKLMAARVV